MMFLPYHSFGITWLHRGLVAIDVFLNIVGWTLFFKYSGAKSPLLPFRTRPRLRYPDGAKHCLRLTKIFGDLACQSNSAPYLAIGLIR